MADSQPGVDARALKACGALLAVEAARFASFGWMRGTSGNLSMVLSREPLRLAVTASGLDKGELSETVPVVPNSQDMKTLSGRIELSRDPRVPAVIVAGHGLYAWGKDIRQARHHTEVVQWLLELALATR